MEHCAEALVIRRGMCFVVAGSIAVLLSQLPGWAAQPINTVNDGRIVKGGTYYNTPDGKTTFQNSGSGGLWIKSDTTVRGLEMNANGSMTNNGGALQFLAPGSVVRIDGKINVNGLIDGKGSYLGNGGKIFVDSAYLFQSGQIYANGNNGGLVQMNVGSAVFAPGSIVEAKGLNGNGGVIAINSDSVVDVNYGAMMDSSGKVSGVYDSNLINIEAGAIRNMGTLRADGVVAAGSADGTRGGTIRLVATGNTNVSQVANAIDDGAKVSAGDPDKTPTFSATEAQLRKSASVNMVSAQDGDILITGPAPGRPNPGLLSAEGGRGAIAGNNDTIQDATRRAGDGGSIILTAMRNVVNAGKVSVNGGDGLQGSSSVNGGNGGAITVLANGNIVNSATPQMGFNGRFQANGGRGGKYVVAGPALAQAPKGGNGGVIAFGYNGQMQNSGVIQASGGVGGAGSTALSGQALVTGGHGGQGGLIVLSGNANPIGKGIIDANGGRGGNGLPGGVGGVAGAIVSVTPATLKNTQIAFQSDGGKGNTLGQSTPPPILGAAKPLTQQTAENELISNSDTLILLTKNAANGLRQGDLSQRASHAVIRSTRDPNGTGQAATDMLAKDAFNSSAPYRHLVIGSSADTLRLNMNRDPVFPLKDSEVQLNQLNTLTVLNDGYTTNTSQWSLGDGNSLGGGRISILATGDIENGTGLMTFGQASGGSINLASKGTINNFDLLMTSNLNDGKGLHGGSLMLNAGRDITNFGFRLIASSGGIMGGTQRYNANRNVMNLGDITSVTFNAKPDIAASGGSINVRAGAKFINGNETFSPSTLQATAMANNLGYGGSIRVKAQTIDNVFGSYDTSGSKQNGKVITGP